MRVARLGRLFLWQRIPMVICWSCSSFLSPDPCPIICRSNDSKMTKIKIWDLPIRIFHWLLPLLLGFSWYSAENRLMDWHRYSGYGILGLLSFRLCWGLWGSHTARFSSFVKSPARVFAYARGGGQGPSGFAGHNPLGGWSVVALLLVLAAQVGSGLFAVDVDGLESGPLSYLVSFDGGRWLANVHGVSFNILLA